MRQSSILAIMAVLSIGVITACNAPDNKSRTEPPTSTPAASTPSANASTEIDRVLGITAGFKPTYKVLKVEDVSTATASRKVVHISLPKGTDQAAIEDNLRQAAKEAYEKDKPDAVEVHGYVEGRTIDASNVLGSLTFAPYGDWGRAAEKPSLDKYKAEFKERNPYLPPIDEETPKVDSGLEKQALAGDYQAQRNLAYYLSTGAEGHPQNVVAGCAWRIVLLKSGHAQADASDESNKTFDCDRKLNPQQLREAEVQAAALLKKIKKR
jgi:hypothetical protein